MRACVVLRPAPGADRTVAALTEAGLSATTLPLFAVQPVPWTAPVGDYDAVILTSANAVRHAGTGLSALGLPVLAVGPATAAAARAAGLAVAATGTGGVAELLEAVAGRWPRLLHLAGRERTHDPRLTVVTVYAADPLPVAAADLAVLDGAVVLAHSARAAARLAELVDTHDLDRARMMLAALGPAVADAAGPGWAAVAVADQPTDTAIVAAAGQLTAVLLAGISA